MLLEKLIEKQVEGGYSDRAFAREKLRVPRSTWQRTRSGTMALGRRVAVAAKRAFPDLAKDVDDFLLSDANE